VQKETATSWQRWKRILSPLLKAGDFVGISDESMTAFVNHLGDFLHDHVDPRSPEQQLMKELWDIASPEEQRTLASLLIRAMKEY